MSELHILARHVLASTCGNSHWLGLDVDDLVHEGWLAKQHGQHPYHAMRRCAMHWLRAKTEPPMVQHGSEDIAMIALAYTETKPTLDPAPFISRLSIQKQRTIMAIYFDHQTPAHVARALGVPVAAVYKWRYEALQQLRRLAQQVPRARKKRMPFDMKAWRKANPEKARAQRQREFQRRKERTHFQQAA